MKTELELKTTTRLGVTWEDVERAISDIPVKGLRCGVYQDENDSTVVKFSDAGCGNSNIYDRIKKNKEMIT